MNTAGYSGTSLWRKLGFKPGMKVALINAPAHYMDLLADRPDDVSFTRTAKASDAIHLFLIEAAGLTEIAKLAGHLPPATMLWVSWPKLSSGLSKRVIRKSGYRFSVRSRAKPRFRSRLSLQIGTI